MTTEPPLWRIEMELLTLVRFRKGCLVISNTSSAIAGRPPATAVRADEDRSGGDVSRQGRAAGEVVAVVQEAEDDAELGLGLGVLVEVVGQGGADVGCRDGHGDHLLK
ncbi:hypothetical protein ACFPH6_03985 [Streptomyces xiangluensis]|uniref:Uncharacterized protein n=1 Tax=Streptomyces xiangluensis TaxID=2665720 RepID=A0ABV8YHY2_9ACTN